MLLVDLDGFKEVTDSFGHAVGICLLTEGTGSRSLDPPTLMGAIDSAMYRDKSRGMGKTEFTDPVGVMPGVV